MRKENFLLEAPAGILAISTKDEASMESLKKLRSVGPAFIYVRLLDAQVPALPF